MRKKYHAPSKEFFRLPNQIFDVPMTPIQFTIYAYLVCCAGSKGYPWQSQHYSKAQKYHHILWCDTALHPQHMVVKNQDLALQPFLELKTKKGASVLFLLDTKANLLIHNLRLLNYLQ